ncbi:MAG: hypothetical protein WAO24_03430 [Peptococcia bacterium]
MASVCPVCNGFYYKELSCPECSDTMIDYGILEGFMEPYRPYLDRDNLEKVDGVPSWQCLHLFFLP